MRDRSDLESGAGGGLHEEPDRNREVQLGAKQAGLATAATPEGLALGGSWLRGPPSSRQRAPSGPPPLCSQVRPRAQQLPLDLVQSGF